MRTRVRKHILLAGVVLALGCDTLLKAPAAQYTDVHFDSYVKSPEPQAGARFGQNVALDETTLVTTAPFEDLKLPDGTTLEDASAAYVLELKHPDAKPVRLTPPNAEAADGTFAGSLLPTSYPSDPKWGAALPALDRDWIAVGLPGEDSALTPSKKVSVEEAEADNSAPEAGAVYVYSRSDLEAAPRYIKAPTAEAGDLFGITVAMSDGWLAVAALGEDSSNADDSSDNGAPLSGAVYMYRYDPKLDDFVFVQYIKAPRIHAHDLFGSAVSIEGHLMAISASLEDGAGKGFDADYDDTSSKDEGAVYTYLLTDGRWTFEAYLKSPQPQLMTAFGMAVKVFGGRIAVGQPFGARCPGGALTPNLGIAYVISRKHGKWADLQCLNPSGRAPSGLFGWALDGYQDQLVVGAAWDPAAKQSGTAYAFEQDESGIWQERTAIVAPNSDDGDAFGAAVGVNSTTIAIGAFGEAGARSGPEADLSNNAAKTAGAVYLFSMH